MDLTARYCGCSRYQYRNQPRISQKMSGFDSHGAPWRNQAYCITGDQSLYSGRGDIPVNLNREDVFRGNNSFLVMDEREVLDRSSIIYKTRQNRDAKYHYEHLEPRCGMHQDQFVREDFGRHTKETYIDTSTDHYSNDLYIRQNRNFPPVIEKNETCDLNSSSHNDYIVNSRIREGSGIYRYKPVNDTVQHQTHQYQSDHTQKHNSSSQSFRGDLKRSSRIIRKSSRETDIKLLASNDTKYKTDAHQERQAGAIKRNMIEVAPGQYMPLCGAGETWRAVQDDFYTPCVCFSCDLTLFCIQNATYVLCPQCQVVNPFDGDESSGSVGLGFTIESLSKWQNKILMKRQHLVNGDRF